MREVANSAYLEKENYNVVFILNICSYFDSQDTTQIYSRSKVQAQDK